MRRLLLLLVVFLPVNPIGVVLAADVAAEQHEIANRVRSILSNRCFACHGPDEQERQAGLRLDNYESLIAECDSGLKAVEPGRSAASELLRRLITVDESERMPPEDFGPRLSQAEIELIRQWIDRGAALPQHWSFVRPVRPAIPDVSLPNRADALADWSQHPIDRFILQEQLRHGLQPSMPATKSELLRRLSLDLTGLPPTTEEVDAFEADDSVDAYERQVERLLASPAFGEHWARKWLDLARYADSAGYADDPQRTIWAYRDWVVNALNDDMPIDQFTIEQLAGDLLPQPTQAQLVATAFHRNTLTNNEGGTNDEEFRNVAVVDRVNTTMAVWMGVTMACAQCHTHKYDPFTQEEYFKLLDIFNQTEDADRRDESPFIELYTAEQLADKQRWERRLQQLQQQLANPAAQALAELDEWDQAVRPASWTRLAPRDFAATSKSDAEISDVQAIRVKPLGNHIVSDTYTLDFELDARLGSPIHAIGLTTIPTADLPHGGAGLGNGNFVVTNISGTLIPRDQQSVDARFVRIELPGEAKILSLAEVQVFSADENLASQGVATQSSTAFAGPPQLAIDGKTGGNYAEDQSTTHTEISQNPWWELDLQAPRSIDKLVIWNRTDNDLYSRLDGAKLVLLDTQRQPVFVAAIDKAPAVSQEWTVVSRQPIGFAAALADFEQDGFPAAATLDKDDASGWAIGGQIERPHQLTLVLDNAIPVDEPATLRLKIEHKSSHRQHLLGSFAVQISSDAWVGDWERLPADLRDIQSKPKPHRSAQEASRLAMFFNRHMAPSTEAARAELSQLSERIASLKPATSVPVMRELAANGHRQTFVQIRGNYKALGAQVQAGTPQVFHPVALRRATDSLPDRLDFARWLVDDKNPLTARVWVNRAWESLFGIGLVRSSEEFGSQGDRPSHPELLDWLACELMEEGWDNKQLLRLLVSSQTYRQTSMVSRELLDEDRDNIWLARGPRVRLSAEMIRDQSLAMSGLLSRQMFGAPVRPPQPNMGLKAAFGSDTDWKTSQGEDRYRRGLYTSWRRSNPYPSMATFDAPSREVCTLRRDSTNTPLQALVTLNDPGFVEAAQGLARRVVIHSPMAEDRARLELAFRICTARLPSQDETLALLELLAAAREQLAQNTLEAHRLATDPLGELPSDADAVDLAAWTSVCNVLLNLDEVLMKR